MCDSKMPERMRAKAVIIKAHIVIELFVDV